MSAPRKKKPSRKDQQQNTQYSYVLGDHLHLTKLENTAARENDLSDNIPAGGRRSTDRSYKGLAIYWNSLSAREQDVTILVCRGHSDAEIAMRLNISIATVRSYLQHVFLKTHIRNRKQLIIRFAGFEFPRNIPPNI